MTTFVLVHGGFHGAWCWYKVAAALVAKGHKVRVPDLPGHGRDETPPAQVSLRDYGECLCTIIDAQDEPVILVGHSMGGGPITLAAEDRPDKIARLVYLAALLPETGATMSEIFRQDTQSAVAAHFVVRADARLAWFRESGLRETFYHDCSNEDVMLARLSLRSLPLAPLEEPIHTSAERFGRVPRSYIECRRDRALSPEVQRRLHTATPCQQLMSLETSHSPFSSAPEALVRLLESCACR